MRRLLRHFSAILLFTVALGLLSLGQAGGQSQGPPESLPHNLRADDQAFLVEAIRDTTAEIQMSELAQQQSQNPAIRQFVEEILRNHTRANIALKELAKTNGVVVPVTIDPTDDSAQEHLASLSGAEFDSEYQSVISDDLKRDLDEFLQATSSVSDPQVKILAAETLLVLQDELMDLRQMQASSMSRQKSVAVA